MYVKTSALRTLIPFSYSLAFTLFLSACATPEDPLLSQALQAADGDPDKLLVVDCLLPGQVRRLGTAATYISARRPIKTTIGLCELRGGEYIAYDRADLSTALSFWLPPAEAGDAEAQANVGEIYERGLGVPPNYAKAAEWYRKAAEQGFARAQTNLGHLYEKGLGVSKDKSQALNWYRKASGLTSDELVFTSSIQELRTRAFNSDQAVTAARQEAVAARQKAAQLRTRVNQLQSQVQSQTRQEQSIRQQLRQARQDLLNRPVQIETETVVKTAPGETRTIVKEVIKEVPKEVVREVVKVVPIEDDTQIKRLKAQLAKQVEEKSRLRKEAELLEKRLQAESKGRSELSEQLNSLEQELEQSKSVKQEIAKVEDGLEQEQIKQLTQAQQDLQAARQAIQEHSELLVEQNNAETEQLRAALTISGEQISELEKTLETSRQQQTKQVDLEVQRANLKLAREQLDATRQEIARQRQQLAQQDDAEIEQLNAKLSAQSGELAKQEDEINKLAEELGNSKEKLAQTEGQIVALEQETEEVKALLRGAESASEVVEKEKPNLFDGLNFGGYHALVIGNNSYANLENLKTAVSDARAIASVLRSRYGFKAQLLVNATRRDILSALNKYREQLGENDNFLLYYAGHGELDRSNDRGHWLPVDADRADSTNWISNTAITDIINAMQAKHVMVIADSCYSGSLTRSVSTSLGGDLSPELQEKWLEKMITLRSRTVLTSGGLQPVLDSGGGSHSIFARTLLSTLRNNDTVLEGPVLFSKVARRVKSAANKLGHKQTPEYAPIQFAGDLGAPFFFRPNTST